MVWILWSKHAELILLLQLRPEVLFTVSVTQTQQSSDHMEAWQGINRETENHEPTWATFWEGLTHTHTHVLFLCLICSVVGSWTPGCSAALCCCPSHEVSWFTHLHVVLMCQDEMSFLCFNTERSVLADSFREQQNFRKVMKSLKMSQMYNKCALFADCVSVVSLNHISASQTASNLNYL